MTYQPSLFDQLWARKVAFLTVFFVIFTLSYGFLYAIDFLPEAPTKEETELEDTTTSTPVAVTPTPEVTKPTVSIPLTIEIPTLDRTVEVLNPSDSSVAALDEALLKGVVRHPDSAKLGEEGNVLLLGHSSYLPTVFNHNFQAFNGIQALEYGDEIIVMSNDTIYTYRVEKVYEAKAAAIAISTDVTGKRLTLITCNSFGTKEDRFIVEATLKNTESLTQTALR